MSEMNGINWRSSWAVWFLCPAQTTTPNQFISSLPNGKKWLILVCWRAWGPKRIEKWVKRIEQWSAAATMGELVELSEVEFVGGLRALLRHGNQPTKETSQLNQLVFSFHSAPWNQLNCEIDFIGLLNWNGRREQAKRRRQAKEI